MATADMLSANRTAEYWSAKWKGEYSSDLLSLLMKELLFTVDRRGADWLAMARGVVWLLNCSNTFSAENCKA